MTNIIEQIAGESENLALHVDLCQQRYLQLIDRFAVVDHRLDKIETVLVEIKDVIQNNQTETYQKYLAWAGVIITALTGLVVHLLVK